METHASFQKRLPNEAFRIEYLAIPLPSTLAQWNCWRLRRTEAMGLNHCGMNLHSIFPLWNCIRTNDWLLLGAARVLPARNLPRIPSLTKILRSLFLVRCRCPRAPNSSSRPKIRIDHHCSLPQRTSIPQTQERPTLLPAGRYPPAAILHRSCVQKLRPASPKAIALAASGLPQTIGVQSRSTVE